MRELFHLDTKKLKEEDRRFLLSKNSKEFLFNKEMIMQNIFLIISMFALFTSLVAIILPLAYISNIIKTLVIMFFIVLVAYLLYTLISSLIKILKQQKIIEFGYNELFKYHFNYSLKKGEIKLKRK